MGPVTEQSEHLSNAQIENYGIRTSGAGPEAAQRDEHQRANHQSIDDQPINDQSISDRQIDDQRVEAHLADCASCRNRLLGFHRSLFTGVADSPEADPSGNDTLPSDYSPSDQRSADAKLEGSRPTGSALADSKFANPNDPVDPQVRTAPTPECPSTEALRELAAGLTPDDLAAKLTHHAATCDHCGPLLRAFTEDFSDDFSPEEQAVLNNLQSASADWQRNTAREMLNNPRVTPDPVPAIDWRRFFSWKWILFFPPLPRPSWVYRNYRPQVYLARRDTPEKVGKYLAEAYPEQRTIEMRWPGARWGEPSDTLGAAPASKPLSLAQGGRRDPAPDTGHSQKKTNGSISGQNEILGGGELLQLIKDLTEPRIAAGLNSMFDLAIANFRMGEVTHDRKYYEKSKNVLDEMLASSRDPRLCLTAPWWSS